MVVGHQRQPRSMSLEVGACQGMAPQGVADRQAALLGEAWLALSTVTHLPSRWASRASQQHTLLVAREVTTLDLVRSTALLVTELVVEPLLALVRSESMMPRLVE